MENETKISAGYIIEKKLSTSGRISVACLVLIAGVMCVLAGIAGAEEKTADRKRLVFVGSPYMREKLIKPLVKNYIANSSLSDEDVKLSLGGPRDWLPPGTSEVSWGNADFMLTSRLDWKWRVEDEANITEDERNKLTFYPVARQVVKRDEKVIGGVLYGLMGKKHLSQQGQRFLDYLDTDEAHKVIEKQYRFVLPSKKVPTYEAPFYVDTKPWNNTARPLMVHGVDVHPQAYRTTMIAELAKIRMEGYNGVMVGGQSDAMMAWAEENGMMLSGKPKLTKEDLEGRNEAEAMAKKTHRFANLRALFLGNEDRVGKLIHKVAEWNMKKDGDAKSESKEDKKIQKIVAGFPDYLKKKHGSLSALNEAWGTDFTSWENVSFPSPKLDELKKIAPVRNKGYLFHTRFKSPLRYYYMRDYPDLLDAYRYVRKVWAGEYDEKVAGFKDKVRDGFLYATKTDADPFVQREVKSFNAASWDHTICKFPPQELQVLVDTVQTGAGRPVWNSEEHLYSGKHNYGETPQRARYVLLRNYLMGQFQSTEYDRSGTTGKGMERFHDGWVRKTREQIQKNRNAFRAFLETRANADIAVLVTEGNRGWNTFPDGPKRPEMGGAVKAYAYVGALGRPWKYVLNRDVSAEHVSNVLIIDAKWLTDATLERIVELPEDRRVVVVGEIPSKNEYREALPSGQMKEFRDRAVGVEGWQDLSKVINPAPELPGIYRNVDGAEFWYWSPWQGVYRYTIPVPVLECRRAQMDGKQYVAVINHSTEGPFEAPVPWQEDKQVRDHFNVSRTQASTGLCAVAFLGGIPFATGGGVFLLGLIDHFLLQYGLVIVGIFESIIVGWYFTARRLRSHIDEAADMKISHWGDVSMRIVLTVLLGLTWYGLARTGQTESLGEPGGIGVQVAMLAILATMLMVWVEEHWLDFDVKIVIPALLIFILNGTLMDEVTPGENGGFFEGYHKYFVMLGPIWLAVTLVIAALLERVTPSRVSDQTE